MSGAEFLFVSQSIEAGYSLLRLTRDVINRVRHYSQGLNQVPQKFLELEDCLALLHLILQRTKHKASSLTDADRKILDHVVKGCESRIAKVTLIFHKYHLSDCSGYSFDNLIKAVQSVAKDGEVQKLVGEIERHLTYISNHDTSLTPTAEEISDVITPELGSRIERSISTAVRKLKASQQPPGTPQTGPSHLDQAHNGHQISAQHVTYNYFNGVPPEGAGLRPQPSRSQLSTTSLPPQLEGLGSPIHVTDHDPFQDDIEERQAVSMHDRSRLSVDSASLMSGHSFVRTRPRSHSRSSARSRASSVHSTVSSGSGFSTYGMLTSFASPATDTSDFDPMDSVSPQTASPGAAVESLTQANLLLAKAENLIPTPSMPSARVKSATSESRSYFNLAVDKFSSIPGREPLLALRRQRGLTYASLGLTKVTKGTERDRFMECAVSHTAEARVAARRCSEAHGGDPYARNALPKVRLDQAAVKARQARLSEKRRTPSEAVANMRMEAFRLYEQVAEEMCRGCTHADDYDVHAQALLGCLEVAKTLQGSMGVRGRTTTGVCEPLVYYDRAQRSVSAAIGLSTSTSEARQAVELTYARLNASLMGQSC